MEKARKAFEKLDAELLQRFLPASEEDPSLLDTVSTYAESPYAYILFYLFAGGMCFLLVGFNAGEMLVDYNRFYSTYANKFFTHVKFISWITIGTRAINSKHGFNGVLIYLFLPILSVSLSFLWFLIAKEWTRLQDRKKSASIDVKDFRNSLFNYTLRPELQYQQPAQPNYPPPSPSLSFFDARSNLGLDPSEHLDTFSSPIMMRPHILPSDLASSSPNLRRRSLQHHAPAVGTPVPPPRHRRTKSTAV